MHGRVGYYTTEHRDLLLLIKELVDQGMNLNAVSYLLHQETAREQMVKRLQERAARDPKSARDLTLSVTDDQIAQLRGNDPSIVDRLESVGLIKPKADGSYEASAILFTSGRELFEQGVPNMEIIKIFLSLAEISTVAKKTKNPDQVARVLVDLFDLMVSEARR